MENISEVRSPKEDVKRKKSITEILQSDQTQKKTRVSKYSRAI